MLGLPLSMSHCLCLYVLVTPLYTCSICSLLSLFGKTWWTSRVSAVCSSIQPTTLLLLLLDWLSLLWGCLCSSSSTPRLLTLDPAPLLPSWHPKPRHHCVIKWNYALNHLPFLALPLVPFLSLSLSFHTGSPFSLFFLKSLQEPRTVL